MDELLNNEMYLQHMEKMEHVHLIEEGKWDWEHGLQHALRVANTGTMILKQLQCNQEEIQLYQIAAMLHDIALVDGVKEGHALKSSQKCIFFLDQLDLTFSQKQQIIQAIASHSNGKDESVMGSILYLSDKLDVTYHRVENSSVHDFINQEFYKVKEVTCKISQNQLAIDYRVDTPFDFSIFKYWPKALKAPILIGKRLKKEVSFFVNDDIIDDQMINQIIEGSL